MPRRERVLITGLGLVTPIGIGRNDFWAGVRRGQSAVRRLSRFDPAPFTAQLATEVDGFDACAFMSAKRARRLDRYSQFAVAASVLAISDASLTTGLADAGCYVGSALGGVAFAETQHGAFLTEGVRGVSPSLALSVFGAAGPSNIAMELGMRGPVLANSNSCASGAVAIGEAFRLIRDGHQQVMLAGGVETPLAPLTFGSFALIRAMSPRASRPFDTERDGFVMGEGAAMLVLESGSHAEGRGARAYAEIGGYGTTNDAYDMLAPLPDGTQATRAIALALADASVEPEDVGYVNAHASATQLGDRAEVKAILRALGDHVPVSGTKGLYGHPLGASGAIETAICALALYDGWLPGTTNLVQPDADNPLRLIGPCGTAAQPRTVLNTAFGFGGINAALVLGAA
jgi:3-oxoacyl-[acyl-carrier-protein] synthase II